MRTLISALAAAGLLLAAGPVATADDETTTTTTPTTTSTTTTTTEEPGETTATSTTAEILGPNDQSLTGLTFAPDKKTYRPGDTFTATMTVGNDALRDSWGVAGSFPAGLSVTGSTGLAAVETGAGTVKGFGADKLDPGMTATVTVTFRAEAEASGPVTFRLSGGLWPDVNPDNDTVTREVVVAATTPATTPTPPTAAPQPKLADTGASATAPLLAGGVLVLLGGGLLMAVRRRNP